MKIMLDAGHGYDTAGKRSPDGMNEYEFNRAVASKAKALLETYKDVTVYFAHSDTHDVPLQERTDAANRLQVNAYVAIHANAYGTTWNDAGGIETYVMPSKPKEATELAQKIQKYLVTMTGLKNRGVKTADFHVLRETHMTAVLAECGFMTNKTEDALLHTDVYRNKCAEAIVKGIAEQYKLIKLAPAPPVTDKTPAPSTGTVKTPPPDSPAGMFRVVAGSFQDKQHADELVKRLKANGYDATIEFQPKK